MIKNATIFRIQLPQPMQVLTFDHAIESQKFNPCGATQESACGWASPRGHDWDAMVENIGSHLIMRFVRETKAVPGQAIQRELDEQIAKIQREQDRKPGRKEKRELREEIVRKLLPHAFAKRVDVPVWINPVAGLLVIGSTSSAITDLIVTGLIYALDGVKIGNLDTAVSPQAAMTQWLAGANEDWPMFFAAGRDVELHSGDEFKTVVKYNRHRLDDEEMKRHIGQGKLPVSLALDWNDRVQFTLTKAGQIRKIKFLDTVFEGQKAEDAGGFDADWAITAGELSALITDLIRALGGEMDKEGGAA